MDKDDLVDQKFDYVWTFVFGGVTLRKKSKFKYANQKK